MASVIDSARDDEADLVLTWSGRWTLAHRILAVNVLTLGIFALAILTLDAYRNQIEAERSGRVVNETQLAAAAIGQLPPDHREEFIARLGKRTESRVRVYAPDGGLLAAVELPERVSNLCFGGPDGHALYITASTSLYRLRTATRDAVWAR